MAANHKKSLYANLFALSIVHIVNYIFPLLTWPLLARHLGIDAFGVLMVIFAIYSISNIVTDFGFNFSATYTISQNQHRREVINRLLGNIFTVKTLLALITMAAALPYIYFDNSRQHINILSLIIIGATIFFQSFQCIFLFQGIEKMKYITISNLLSKLAYLLFIVFALPYHASLNTALAYFLINHILLFILYIVFIKKEGYHIRRPQWQRVIHELRHGLSFFLARMSVAVYTSINILVVGHFNGVQAASLYSASEKLYGAGTGMANILSQALYPHIAKTGNISFLIRVIAWVFIPFSALCLTAAFFADRIIILTFGANFAPAADYLRLFLILACIVFVSISISYPGFASIRKLQTVNYIIISGAILHIIGLTVLYFYQLLTPENIIYLTILIESVILALYLIFLFIYYQYGHIRHPLRRKTAFRHPLYHRPTRQTRSPFWRHVGMPHLFLRKQKRKRP